MSKSGVIFYVNTIDRTSTTVRPKSEAVATPAAVDAGTGEKCCGAAHAMDATSDERRACGLEWRKARVSATSNAPNPMVL